MTDYYSEQISGPEARTETEFSQSAWGAIVAHVRTGVSRGVFAQDFPATCPDGHATYGCDTYDLRLAVEGEHSAVTWPLNPEAVPPAPAALDLIEFFYARASEPRQREYHDFYGHHHLTFDRKRGQEAFRKQINVVFARNGLAYELGENGRVTRLLEPVLQRELTSGLPPSGDEALDDLVARAESRFLSPDLDAACDALEKLWDAFERVKTVLDAESKKRSVAALIAASTTTPSAADLVDAEMAALTDVGNSFRIRHHEMNKHPVPDELVDYLFIRMYSLLRLLFDGLERAE